MKFLERVFYKGYWYFGNGTSMTIKNWFNVKGDIFHGIKHEKKRHKRSMRYTDMMALIGDNDNYRFTRIGKEIGRRKHGKWLYMPKRVRME